MISVINLQNIGLGRMRFSLGDITAEIAIASGARDWAACGFPCVHLESHKYAAALATTDVRLASVPVKEPWGAFMVDLPGGLFRIDLPAGGQCDLVRALVRVAYVDGARRWSVNAFGVGSAHLYRVMQTDEEWTAQEAEWDTPAFAGNSSEMRVLLGICHLVTGVCLEIAGRKNECFRHKSGRKIRARAKAGEPAPVLKYVLGRPVSLDCRPALAAYLAGDRDSIAVRYMVRGHWRNQACGKGGLERKTIWIQPHWKGEGPVNVRSHVLDPK